MKELIIYLTKQHNLEPRVYEMILHLYHKAIDYEQLFIVRFDSEKFMSRIT